MGSEPQPNPAPADGPASPLLRRMPTWQGNLAVFGVLVAGMLGYFFWQERQAEKSFLAQVHDGTRLLAGVIQLNARTAELSQQVVEEIMETFLGNSARFVAYLDSVEPFAGAELAAFAAEAGLAGIRIQPAGGGGAVEGPAGWLPDPGAACPPDAPRLRHLPARHLYHLTTPRPAGGCITVGIAARRIETLQRQVALPSLLQTLSGLGGIRYVRLTQPDSPPPQPARPPDVALRTAGGTRVAEARLSIDSGRLVVGLDAAPFHRRLRRLRQEFIVFASALALTGIFLSWILYRIQQAYLLRVRQFERRLAREREDATLGRAAASIAHEIRNPLNAISMGLQRLEIEAGELGAEHRRLLAAMRGSVDRTNGIIEDIRRFARPLVPARRNVALAELVRAQLTLYAPQFAAQSIRVDHRLSGDTQVLGDRRLLEEVVENLLKNALEAQPEGGQVTVAAGRRGGWTEISMENGGYALAPRETDRLLEPWFTTKTRGTGLGLTIVRRIVGAHGGHLALNNPAPGRLRVEIRLPRPVPAPPAKGTLP